MLCDLLTAITPWLRFVGWAIVGIATGASISAYALIQSLLSGKPLGLAKQKLMNGIIGGALGGGCGGLLFSLFDLFQIRDSLPRTSVVLGLVVLGTGIGLLAGLAQFIVKEAWIQVESGFRPGRELLLAKAETTIGRAEACDLGLFRDNSIDRLRTLLCSSSGTWSRSCLKICLPTRVFVKRPTRARHWSTCSAFKFRLKLSNKSLNACA